MIYLCERCNITPHDSYEAEEYSIRKSSKRPPIEYAFRILSIKDYSEAGMREKLISRYTPQEAKEVIERLKELNYIDDLRYAENFIVSKLLSGYGVYAVVRKLREKGVDVNMGFVRSVAEKRDINTEELLVNAMKKYLAKTHGDNKIAARQKCLAFMMRRGFDINLAEKYFERLADESDISERR